METVADGLVFDLDNTLLDRQAAFKRLAENFYEEHLRPTEVRGAGRSGRDDGPVGWRRLHRQGRNAYAVAQRVAGRRPGYGVTEEMVPLRDGATGEAGRRGQRIPSPSERTTGALGHSYKRLDRASTASAGKRAWTSSQRSSSFPKRLATGNRTPGYSGMRWRRLGSQRPEQVMFVGDNPMADIDGAKRFGMKAAWVRRGRPYPPDLAPPDHVIDHVIEVRDIVTAAQ